MNQFKSIIILVTLFVSTVWQVNASTTFDNEPATFVQLPYDDIESGSLFFKTTNGYQFQLSQQSDFQVDVTGMLARIVLTQSFSNTSEDWVEALYLFPLSEKAVVDGMEMEIGERKIVGEIREKKQAKKLYQQAKKAGKKTSLLSQKRPNMFTSKVANIAPGETIKVKIKILQPITFTDNEFSLRLPLTITPRFTPSSISNNAHENNLKGKDIEFDNNLGWASHNPIILNVAAVSQVTTTNPNITNSQHQLVNIDVALSVGLPLADISSDNHKIIQKKKDSQSYSISLIPEYGQRLRLDADFVLRWKPKTSDIPQAAFFKTQDEQYDYGYFMLMPPSNKQVKSIAKEVIYIIDTSGSMGGTSMRQAKRALQYGLSTLRTGDTFNIIEFDTHATQMSSQSLPVTPQVIDSAIYWVENLQAHGGTEMEEALSIALNIRSEENRLRQVIFITDGSVSNEESLFNLIEDSLLDTRLHTIGIGSAPNSYFMSEAAKAGRGTYRYISDINQVNQQMSELFNDISRPMMQNIALDWPSEQVEFYPKKIPDLYEGQPLLVTARWVKDDVASTEQWTVKGQLAKQSWQQSVNLTRKGEDSGIDKLWARAKVRELENNYRRVGVEEQEAIKQAILSLSLHHQIMSPYTSFIAIEQKQSRPVEEQLASQKIENLVPKGSQVLKTVPIANTSLGINNRMTAAWYLLLLSVLLGVAYYIVRVNQRNG